MALGLHAKLRTGHCAQSAVAGAVAEQWRTEHALAARANFECGDRSDFGVAVGRRIRGEMAKEERDGLFAANDLLFPIIDKIAAGGGRIGGVIGEFFNNLAEVRIFAA